MTALKALFARELALAVRIGGGALMAVVFFLIVVTVIPFGVGPDLNVLARIGPAILWIGVLLANLLAIDRLFQADQEDGSLDLIVMSPVPLEMTVAVKALAYWMTTGLPLTLAAPLFGMMLNVPPQALGAICLTLLAGTPALTFIGTIGAALTVVLRRGGLLLAILVVPLMIPVLIFGISATTAVITGPTPFLTPFLILVALSLFSLVLGPLAAAAALRASLD
ncbi:MAG: heme exporter protein CcmB [Rhodobiaceae bacterium]|nr:heme exporter protein CcmB [Rhodobiaceae bacterium]MCC0041274.1 heme exporter protein CcmB [Rhodobiaceae bacterium]